VENKSAEIQQLTIVIQQKDQELAACANKLADSDRHIEALRVTMEDMRAEIRQLTENVQKAEHEFEDRQTR
jgi:predicted  nucleic acid-binding Zn-ribbon protein